ncbi:protein C3orf33 homolog [Halictus rubicundus]|uniref:protein C3orf33 homolog n=1 Tax=Halictus rubicundus TaxID=77578 RepID=UPI0040353463
MGSEEKLSSLERYLAYSEIHTETIKVITYGISGIALVIALHRVRPFSKFRSPSSIPCHFMHKKVPLQGTVKRIEPSHGTLLMVDHKPLIALPRLNNKKFLPIKIAGLNVTSNGINWLQTIINGQNINFIPLFSTKEYLNCIVATTLQQNKEQIRIGEDLVRLGFAVVEQDSLKSMLDNKDVLYYQKRLLNAQKRAKRERNGYWQFTKQPTLLWKIQQSLNEKVERILSKFTARFRI